MPVRSDGVRGKKGAALSALHDRVPWASAPLWDGPVDVLLRHLDRTALAVDAVLSVDHLITGAGGRTDGRTDGRLGTEYNTQSGVKIRRAERLKAGSTAVVL